jgi:hypothetical protein
MKYLALISFFILTLNLVACGKKEETISESEETEVVDQVDHSSDVPNDPVFKQQN